MTLYENILTMVILLGLFILGYLKMTGKNFPEALQELKEIFSKEKVDLDLKCRAKSKKRIIVKGFYFSFRSNQCNVWYFYSNNVSPFINSFCGRIY